MTEEHRFTFGLIIDVLDVLERHGYHRYDNQHTGHAVLLISDLAKAYAGHDQVQPSYLFDPVRAVPEADRDAVILTGPEIRSVVAALDVAVDYKRDRAETCADCADQSCPACHSRMRDAQAYDRIAAQMLGTSRAPDSGHREPQRLGDHDADREVGQ